jgi:hypothetical protein
MRPERPFFWLILAINLGLGVAMFILIATTSYPREATVYGDMGTAFNCINIVTLCLFILFPEDNVR